VLDSRVDGHSNEFCRGKWLSLENVSRLQIVLLLIFVLLLLLLLLLLLFEAKKLERIQQKFASVCFYRFFPHGPYSYTSALEILSLHSLLARRYHLEAFFFCSGLSWP
jgi:hypothetical protein